MTYTSEQLEEMGLIRFRDTNGDARWQYLCTGSWARAIDKDHAVRKAIGYITDQPVSSPSLA